MSKSFIKKIISAENELKFIKLDLIESSEIIDKIILVEANYTHSGIKREFLRDDLINNLFDSKERERIIHLKVDIEKYIYKNTKIAHRLHFNERIIRGLFEHNIKLNNNDIIFSLDADEVLYRETYINLINKIKNTNNAYQIRLYNLVYRPDYLWTNFDFIAPTLCRVDFYKSFKMRIKSKFKKFKQWRYHGEICDHYGGVHFNWHLTPKEMVEKLNNYAHKDLFVGKGYDENYFKKCIENRKFYDPTKKCEIEKIDIYNNNILPKSFISNIKNFNYLLDENTIQ